jgi:signal transduction histidine kinase
MDSFNSEYSLVSINFDLIGVVVAVIGILILATVVFLRSTSSITSRSFFFFAVVTIFWGLSNYFLYKFTDPELSLIALRLHIFLTIWHAYAFFQLAFVFPYEDKKLPLWHRYVLLPLAFFASSLLLVPFIFESVSKLISVSPSEVLNPEQSQGIILAGVVTFSFFVAGLLVLIRRVYLSKGDERRQVMLMFTGMSLTAGLLLMFSFILPIWFKNFDFVPYGALFIFPVIVFTAYAIYLVELFHVKNIFAGLFTFFLCVVSLIELILAESVEQVLLRVAVFFLTLIIGIQLVKNTFEIEMANEQKSELMSFATHEIRTPLTVMRGYATMLLDGDKGDISEETRGLLQKILISGNDVIALLSQYLDKSKIELGQIEYIKSPFDLTHTVNDILNTFQINAGEKHLALTKALETKNRHMIFADQAKIKEVITNIIDNALKYTEHGSVNVSLRKEEGTVILKVSDTGIGLDKETIPHLFKEFSRADLKKVNILGSGIGLYLAKKFVEAHKGRIWVESEGEGKGTQFYISLPEYKR